MSAVGLVRPITAHTDPAFQVAIGRPRVASEAPAMEALHSYVPPLLNVSVAIPAPVIGVRLTSEDLRKPEIELVAPVMLRVFVPKSRRAALLMVRRLVTVIPTEALTFAAVLEMVRFLKLAVLASID